MMEEYLDGKIFLGMSSPSSEWLVVVKCGSPVTNSCNDYKLHKAHNK